MKRMTWANRGLLAACVSALAVLASSNSAWGYTPVVDYEATGGAQCSSGYLCTFADTHYGLNGTDDPNGIIWKWMFDQWWADPDHVGYNGWVAGDLPIRSAKDKFGNRRVQISTYGGTIKCLDPGEVAPTINATGPNGTGGISTKIGVQGSRC